MSMMLCRRFPLAFNGMTFHVLAHEFDWKYNGKTNEVEITLKGTAQAPEDFLQQMARAEKSQKGKRIVEL